MALGGASQLSGLRRRDALTVGVAVGKNDCFVFVCETAN